MLVKLKEKIILGCLAVVVFSAGCYAIYSRNKLSPVSVVMPTSVPLPSQQSASIPGSATPIFPEKAIQQTLALTNAPSDAVLRESIAKRAHSYNRIYKDGGSVVAVLSDLARQPFIGASELANRAVGDCLGSTDGNLLSGELARLTKARNLTEAQTRMFEAHYRRCAGANGQTLNATLVSLRAEETRLAGQSVTATAFGSSWDTFSTPSNQLSTEFSNRLALAIETKDPIKLEEFIGVMAIFAASTNSSTGKALVVDGIPLNAGDAKLLADAWVLAICEFGVVCDSRNTTVIFGCRVNKGTACANSISELIMGNTAVSQLPRLEAFRQMLVSIIASRSANRIQLRV